MKRAMILAAQGATLIATLIAAPQPAVAEQERLGLVANEAEAVGAAEVEEALAGLVLAQHPLCEPSQILQLRPLPAAGILRFGDDQ